ncbi:uncharacterized protein [Parasteatoda tepidariorum]|uniref:uncharacterized protein n=1 Tax=Parasteatoda tepidariorum TaxID=114398 RepID=UPI00077F9B34|nr:TD and POZ domain-containing protein 1-like [Parasteatoda tepidariorum]
MYKTKFTFTWKIENFSFCNHNNGVKLLSPAFGSENFKIIIGSLVLYPRGESKEYSEFISCTLSVLTLEQVGFLQYEIEAIGASGKILKNHKWDKFSTPSDTELKCPDFLAIKDILQDAQECEEDTLTIRCKFLGQNSTRTMKGEDFSCTKIGVDRIFFEMQVLRTAPKKRLITFGSKNSFEFSIFERSENLEATFTRVVIETVNNEPCIVDCTLTLHDKFNSKICSARAKHYFFSVNCTYWKFPSDTLSKEWKSYLKVFKRDPSHRLLIYCEFSVSNGTYFQIYMPKSDSSSPTSAYSSLQEDLRNLFHNKHLSDVKLRVDGEIIEAHKTVLVARSPVFAVMFDHQEMEEARSGIVDIVDIDAYVMKSFLKFLYTDSVDEVLPLYQVISSIALERKMCHVFEEGNVRGERM